MYLPRAYMQRKPLARNVCLYNHLNLATQHPFHLVFFTNNLFIRIDGALQTDSVGKRFFLANDTITLDVQKPGNGTNGNDVIVIVYAFQYKSGMI